MPVNVIDTLKPKNNGSFPVVEAVDVSVSESMRLPEALEAKADASALDATNAAVATKADASALAETNAAVEAKADASDVQTATAELQNEIDQIVISASAESVVAPEVAAARVSEDSTVFSTLKERLDTQHASTESKLGTIFEEIRYESPNLYDKDDEDIETGGFYNYINQWTANPDYTESGYIPCENGDTVMVKFEPEGKFRNQLGCCVYNANKEYIGGLQISGSDTTIDYSNAKYIRIPVPANKTSTTIVIAGNGLTEDDFPDYYVPYGGIPVKSEIEKLKIADDDISGMIEDINEEIRYESPNLYDKDDEDIETGGFYNYINQWTANPDYTESGYIPCENGDTVMVKSEPEGSFLNQLSCCVYNANKEYIGGFYISGSDTTVDYSNAKYLRIPVRVNKTDTEIVLVGKDLTADDFPDHYVPYGEITISDEINALKFEIDELKREISEQTQNNKWLGKTWYAYGTSITNINSEGKYPTYLAQLSGMNLVCKGISGGGIGDLGAYSNGQVYDAICNITDGKLDADIITIETGANDTGEGVPVGSIYDTGTETLCGCLNDCLRYLQANTDAQIVVMPSPPSKAVPTEQSHYFYEWRFLIEKICKINGVHYIDVDANLGFAKYNSESKGSMYVVDSIHQTNLGGYILAENMWSKIKNIPLFRTQIPNASD